MQFTIADYTDVVSPLDLVMRIVAAGAFVASWTTEPKPGEVTLGVLTGSEKAIFSAHWFMINHLETLGPKLREFEASGAAESPEGKSLLDQCNKTEKWIEVLRELFWTSVETRFAEQLLAAETKNLAVRAGFQVVIMQKMAPSVDLFTALDELLGESHKCTECEHYDGCSLPFKKPREAPATQTAP